MLSCKSAFIVFAGRYMLGEYTGANLIRAAEYVDITDSDATKNIPCLVSSCSRSFSIGGGNCLIVCVFSPAQTGHQYWDVDLFMINRFVKMKFTHSVVVTMGLIAL